MQYRKVPCVGETGRLLSFRALRLIQRSQHIMFQSVWGYVERLWSPLRVEEEIPRVLCISKHLLLQLHPRGSPGLHCQSSQMQSKLNQIVSQSLGVGRRVLGTEWENIRISMLSRFFLFLFPLFFLSLFPLFFSMLGLRSPIYNYSLSNCSYSSL